MARTIQIIVSSILVLIFVGSVLYGAAWLFVHWNEQINAQIPVDDVEWLISHDMGVHNSIIEIVIGIVSLALSFVILSIPQQRASPQSNSSTHFQLSLLIPGLAIVVVVIVLVADFIFH